MAGYYQLPQYNPGNALNFEPLNNAVSGYKDAQSRNALSAYTAEQDKIQNNRQNALMGMQQKQENRAQTSFDQGQHDRANKALAATFQAIGTEPAERRAQLYAKVRSRVKDFDQDIIGAGGDPNDMEGTIRLVTAQARGYVEPSKPDVKEVNGRLVRVSPDASSATEIYSTPGVGNFKTSKEAADAEEGIRKEFTAQSKNFVTIRDAYNNVQQLASNPSPAADIGLVYSIMKVFDPTSVVRESEYATAQNAAGVPDQLRNTWNRILSGERLNDNQRADFVNQAKTIYGAQEQTYNRTRNQYQGISERLGLNPQNTIIDFANPRAAGPAQNEPSGIAGGMPSRSQPSQPGAQGQIPPGAVQMLRSQPTPEIIQQFEQKYGPGSAQQFLGR
ncbi:MAG: hypothetical protein WC807_18435 [Hyphomicrobium sp.]|jgi:hypothetical protein